MPALVSKHGGVYLARGGHSEAIEGSWHPGRIVLFRFPDRAAVRAFFNDPEYQPLRALRQRASTGDIVMVDGLE